MTIKPWMILALAWVLFFAIVGPTLLSARDSLAVVVGFILAILLIGVTWRVVFREYVARKDYNDKTEEN